MVAGRSALAVGHPVRLELHLPGHDLTSLGEVGLHAVGLEVAGRLLDALDLALDVPLLALAEAALDHVDHGGVEAGVEVAAGGDVGLVGAIQPSVRVEVAAQLEDQVKGVLGALGQQGQAVDVGQKLEHAGGEVCGGDGVVEVVLQAVQVEVDNGDLAVELRVERVGGVGRGGVHDLGDGRGHVWPQSALVDPAVDFGALGLELVDPRLHVGQLALELINLLRVRAHRLVEGGRQQVGHGLSLERAGGWHGGAVGHAAMHAVAAAGHAADGHLWLLLLLRLRLLLRLAGVHVGLVVGVLERLVGAAALGALLAEFVKGLAVAVVLYVAVGAR